MEAIEIGKAMSDYKILKIVKWNGADLKEGD